jgi:hypothetical protein
MYTSNHPRHVFGGILKSFAIRMTKLCCREKDLLEVFDMLRKVLERRKYPTRLLDKYLVPTLSRLDERDTTNVLPLVVDWDERIQPDVNSFKHEFRAFLVNNPEYKLFLPSKLTLAWKCTKNLAQMLVNKDSLSEE